MQTVTQVEIEAAQRRLAGRIVPTPLVRNDRFSAEFGADVYFKAENLQHTGSFKVRGAFNALGVRTEAEAPLLGVATFSAGNHGAATAFAARTYGVPCVVVMPRTSVHTKVSLIKGFGGEVVFADNLAAEWARIAAERGYLQLHPFDDLNIIAGQATVGAEIISACPTLHQVIVPVGGGGLISGVATAVKLKSPSTRVIGIEPDGANAVSYALRAGGPLSLPERPVSVADGLTAPFTGTHNYLAINTYVDQMIEIKESTILDAWWEVLDATKLLVEPSASVGIAAVRAGQLRIDPGSAVAFVLSGGNTSRETLAKLG